MGYRGIRSILDKHGANYTRYTIIQALDVKNKLEKLNVREDEVTIVSVDAERMYPTMQCKMVRKAIYYFLSTVSEEVSAEDKMTIDKCLELITFVWQGWRCYYQS